MASKVEPTATQKKAASASHKYLRDLMDTGGIGNRILRSFLSGSYVRGTAVNPLGDVDIIFLIDESKWATGFFSTRPEPSYQKEAPRLCRGGSRSLTFQEVVHRRDFQS